MQKIRGPQAIISGDKNCFVSCAFMKKSPHVMSFFNTVDGLPKPSIEVNINRLPRAQVFLKMLPSIFTMTSDGNKIAIDAVNKLIEFDEANIKGIICYHITDPIQLGFKIDAIFKHEPKPEQIYMSVKASDETKMEPTTLKVFPAMYHDGGSMCIMDSIEKVLHTSLIDSKTGLLGHTDQEDIKRIMIIQQVWPELEITFTVDNDQMSIYSKQIANKFSESGFVKIHKNFGGTDISMRRTHTSLAISQA